MNLSEFQSTLAAHPDLGLRFVIDSQRAIADHFHVTEVGRVEKQFVDCGGVRRSTLACVLQTLVATDVDHRLTTTKLAKIVSLANSLDLPGETPVEIEHQERSIAIDSVESARVVDGMLEFRLSAKQTACLAEDACGLPVLSVVDGGCCSSTGSDSSGSDSRGCC